MQSFARVIQELDDRNKTRFHSISSTEDAALHSSAQQGTEFAPIASNVVFLLPHGEPFFSNLVPRLIEIGARKQSPTIHVGIGGTRNLSIIGLTKADAGLSSISMSINCR